MEKAVNGLMKAFIGQHKFSGKYEEDLDSVLKVFEALAEMCDPMSDEKRKAIPTMLQGNELHLFSKKGKDFITYEYATTLLRTGYNSKKNRTAY